MKSLKAFDFACGYIETHRTRDGAAVTLWAEHGAYHARRNDWRGDPAYWQVSTNLKDARKAVSALTRAK